MRKLLPILLIAIVVFAACSSEPDDNGDSTLVEYGVAGEVTNITPGQGDVLVTIFVQGDENNGAAYQEAYVTITSDTIIYDNEETTYENLFLGAYVQVFFEGPVLESYPVQATAKQVNIIPESALDFQEDPSEE